MNFIRKLYILLSLIIVGLNIPATAQVASNLHGKATIGAHPTLANGSLTNKSTGELYMGAGTTGQQKNQFTLTGNYLGESGSKLYSSITANTNASGTKGYLSISGTAKKSGGSTLIVLDLLSTWDGSRIDLAEALNAGSDIDAFTMNATTASTSVRTAKLFNELSGTKRIWYIGEEPIIVSSCESICEGAGSFTVTLSQYTGAISKWQYSFSPYSTWTDINQTTENLVIENLPQAARFRAVVNGGNITDYVAVSTTPKPVVSFTGSTTICAGSTTTLSPTTGGTWVSNNPSVATVTNAGVVTGVSSGSVTFTYTRTDGCSASVTP